MPKISEENAIRLLMGFCILATLATLFLCVVLTPVLLVIGFAGKFWPAWNALTAHPVWAGLALVAFIALIMFWIALMIVMSYALRGD